MAEKLVDSRYMTADEMLAEEVPAALRGHKQLEASYLRDMDLHKRMLSDSPVPAHTFLYMLANNAFALTDRFSLLFFGGGSVEPGSREYLHVVRTSGQIARRVSLVGGPGTVKPKPFHSVTGSGPGVMQAAHEGPAEKLNGYSVGVGLTLESLLHRERPGEHNKNLLIVKEMARRIELFLRMNQGGVIYPGGPGTIEEFAAVASVLMHEPNKDMHYPFLLSEPYVGKDTYMRRLLKFMEYSVGGDIVSDYFTLHQGRQLAPFSVLMDLPDHSGDHWNWAMEMPEHAFTPFKLDAKHIASIDLTHGRDDPSRFLGDLRKFMNLIVKLTMTNPEFIDENGPPEVRVGRTVLEHLDPMLRGLLEDNRIKTHRETLDDIVRLREV